MSKHPLRHVGAQKQGGLVLLIALVMLVVMTMMGIAMYRQVGLGFAIAGNLAFKQSASSASDRGIEVARQWLLSPAFSNFNAPLTIAIADNPATAADETGNAYAYYAGWCHTKVNGTAGADANDVTDCGVSVVNFDPLTFNWANSGVATWDDGVGNEVRFVVHRLCETDGALDAASQQCVTLGKETDGATRSVTGYGGEALSSTSQPYFRITVRTRGPRNTVVYSQSIMY